MKTIFYKQSNRLLQTYTLQYDVKEEKHYLHIIAAVHEESEC